jgi:predicted PurR-regulated permease PerM
VTNTSWSSAKKVLAIVVVLSGMLWLAVVFMPILSAVISAALLAYFLNPVIRLLIRRTRLSRPWAVGIVYAFFILVLFAIPSALGTVAVRQYYRFEAEFLIALTALEQWISQPIELLGYHFYPHILLEKLTQFAGDALSTLPVESLNLLSGVSTNMLWLLVAFFSLYYFLKDGPKIKPWLVRLTPVTYQYDIQRLLDDLDEVWGALLRVQLLLFAILAFLMIGGTSLVVLLFTTGLLAFSPIIFVLLLIVVYTAAQQVDNLWLRPQLLGRQMQMHPGLVFIGLIAGMMVGGVLGALLSMPLMATAKVVGRYIYCQLLDLPPWPPDEPVESEDGEEQESKIMPGRTSSGSAG